VAENAGRLVSREELLAAIWPGVFVAEENVTGCIAEVRRALGDDGRLLRTVPKRGYMLEAEVMREALSRAERGAAKTATASVPPQVTDRPSLVVLPLANLSGDPEQEYFADGMTEEITTALTRVRWFFIIARNSAFTYKGRPMDVRQVGRELGVRYVLEGSVRRAGRRLRVAVQLVETASAHQIWADRFDSDVENVFDLQDRIAEAVAGAIEPSLRAAEMERSEAKPTESLDAYDLYLRAQSLFYRMTRDGTDVALTLLRRAIALDSDFALAKAVGGAVHVIRNAQGWSEPEELAEGADWAWQALTALKDDPNTLRLAALSVAYLCRDYDVGLAAAERALALNANSAQVLLSCAWVYNYACQPQPAIGLFERAMRLSPRDPELAYMFSGIGLAHLIAGNPGEAARWGERSVLLTPGWVVGHRLLIAGLMLSGRIAEARDAVDRLLRLAPQDRKLGVVIPPLRDEQVRDRYIQALRDAGLPG
jgi:adenylate cyclase